MEHVSVFRARAAIAASAFARLRSQRAPWPVPAPKPAPNATTLAVTQRTPVVRLNAESTPPSRPCGRFLRSCEGEPGRRNPFSASASSDVARRAASSSCSCPLCDDSLGTPASFGRWRIGLAAPRAGTGLSAAPAATAGLSTGTSGVNGPELGAVQRADCGGGGCVVVPAAEPVLLGGVTVAGVLEGETASVIGEVGDDAVSARLAAAAASTTAWASCSRSVSRSKLEPSSSTSSIDGRLRRG